MKKPHGSGGRRHSDGDDHNLWKITTHAVEPLKKAKSRVHRGPAPRDAEAPEPSPRTEAPVDRKSAKLAHGHALAHTHARGQTPTAIPAAAKSATPARKAPPELADFDRKRAKKLRAGRADIDARIDLHGMRQSEAHSALRAFLHRCQGRGMTFVLVITGKGKLASDRDDEAAFDMTVSRERGVLKRNVPRWLDEPDLRAIVVSYTTAAIAHGGDGAIYVHLRKRG
ncbi:MAG: Smr/MutS family protein [Hyphomicrobium sp.]